MLKKLTSAVAMVLLASSFALAAQPSARTAPRTNPRVVGNQRVTTTALRNQNRKHGKKHHKHHKQNKHQRAASRR